MRRRTQREVPPDLRDMEPRPMHRALRPDPGRVPDPGEPLPLQPLRPSRVLEIHVRQGRFAEVASLGRPVRKAAS